MDDLDFDGRWRWCVRQISLIFGFRVKLILGQPCEIYSY